MEKNQRRRRRVKRNKFFVKLILLTIELVILVIVLRRSSLFKLKSIDVVGNSRLAKDRIVELTELSYGENLLRISKSSLEKKIRREPYIETVRVKKKLMNRLIIEISEKKPKAYFVSEIGSAVVVDSQLNFLEIVEQAQLEPEWIQCFGFLKTAPSGSDSLKKSLLAFVENDFFGRLFNGVLSEKVERIEYVEENLYLYFKDSTEVLFGDPYDSSYKIDLLSEVFRDLEANKVRAKRIDMRQKWPVVTKVEGEEDESE